MKKIVRNQRLHDIQLENASMAAISYCGVVTDDLGSNLDDHLRHYGINLAGHDGRARLQSGDIDFTDAAPGAGCKPSDIVSYFGQTDGNSFQCSTGFHSCILRCLGFEVVRRLFKRAARFLSNEIYDLGREFRMRV